MAVHRHSSSRPGSAFANGKLYVADANNHAIRVVDLITKETTTLRIEGLQPPLATTNADAPDVWGPNAEETKVAPQRLRAGIDGTLVIKVELPAGYHLNPAAPQRYRVGFETETKALTLEPRTSRGSSKDLRFPLRVPLRATTKGAANLLVQLTIFYCREDNTGTCRIKTLLFRVPVQATDAQDAPAEIEVSAIIKKN
jgi:hypothetical protein